MKGEGNGEGRKTDKGMREETAKLRNGMEGGRTEESQRNRRLKKEEIDDDEGRK